jgi:hypothetical protein
MERTCDNGILAIFWLAVAQIRSRRGVEPVPIDVAWLDASIGGLLAQFGPLRGVWWAENSRKVDRTCDNGIPYVMDRTIL